MKNIHKRNKYFNGLSLIFLFFAIFGSISCGNNSSGIPVVDRKSDNSANTAAANSEQGKLDLGPFQELQGTEYVISAIGSSAPRQESSSSGDSRYTRNFLFVNVVDKSSHLLFPANDWLILSAENLTEKAEAKPVTPPAKNVTPPAEDKAREKSENPVKWICYRVVKEDTDKDKRLSANDIMTLALSDASGLDYKELITDVTAVLHETRRGDSLIFIYTANGKNHIAEINLPTKQLTSTKELQEIVPK